MFYSGFSVPRGSGVFRASVVRATRFLVLVIVVVLSPNVAINLSGINLIGEIFLCLIAFFSIFCRVDWSNEFFSSMACWN